MKAVYVAAREPISIKAVSYIREHHIPVLTLTLSCFAIVVAFLYPFKNISHSLTEFPVPLLGVLCVAVFLLAFHRRRKEGIWDKRLLFLLGISYIAALLLWALPDVLHDIWPRYVEGRDVNRHEVYLVLFSSFFLLAVAIPLICASLFNLLGSTLRAHDISRYPIIVLPVTAVIVACIILVYYIAREGIVNLSWSSLITPYEAITSSKEGLRNHILGTFLLICFTAAISLPFGVGAGLFMGEYGGRLAGVVRVAVSILRGMSVFILGLVALSIVMNSKGTFLAPLFRASDVSDQGTYLLASLLLSLLVIPVVARATEEGCTSLPRDLRDGSAALGASQGYTLIRLLLPWSLPNIITGLLIGCAEAAGCVAVLMLIAGTGEKGIGPLDSVTSLSFLVFDSYRGLYGVHKWTGDFMWGLQYTAALLLIIITLGLTAVGLVIKHRFTQRYRRGAL